MDRTIQNEAAGRPALRPATSLGVIAEYAVMLVSFAALVVGIWAFVHELQQGWL